MRILAAHNYYRQAGGEDAVFDNEVNLLRGAGHEVETLTLSNNNIEGVARRVAAALMTPYNPLGRAEMAKRIAAVSPDVVHVHNFFPQLSPAIFDACYQADVPVVWTLHNFRLTCAAGVLMRDGQVCEVCVGKVPIPAITHRCYRGSVAGSLAVAGMIWLNRIIGTWDHKVTRFVALSHFAKGKFVSAGLPAERISVKPNFICDPLSAGPQFENPRSGALFVGRISPEKGIKTLIEAWRGIDVPLTIIGDGPERAVLEAVAPPHVTFLGHRDPEFVAEAMRSAEMLIVPSVWQEMFGLTVIEAMANGTPVVVSRIGSLPEIVRDGVTGLHFDPGDAQSLANTVRSAYDCKGLLARMGRQARLEYEDRFSSGKQLAMLEGVYTESIKDHQSAKSRKAQ